MRFTSDGVANLRTRNESTLRGVVEALVRKGEGRVDACLVRRLGDITAFVELPDGVAPAAMVDAARAEGFAPMVLIPLSPDEADADPAPVETPGDHRS
jgi:hypothetical protein